MRIDDVAGNMGVSLSGGRGGGDAAGGGERAGGGGPPPGAVRRGGLPGSALQSFSCQLNLSCFVCETTGSYPSKVLVAQQKRERL